MEENWYEGNDPQNIVKLNDYIPNGNVLYVEYCGSDMFETYKQKYPPKYTRNYPYGEDVFYIKGEVLDCRIYPEMFLVILEVVDSDNASLTPGDDFFVESNRDKVSVIDPKPIAKAQAQQRLTLAKLFNTDLGSLLDQDVQRIIGETPTNVTYPVVKRIQEQQE